MNLALAGDRRTLGAHAETRSRRRERIRRAVHVAGTFVSTGAPLDVLALPGGWLVKLASP